MKISPRIKFLIALLAFAISAPAFAQDSPQDAPADPPSRVMRLQYMDGQVSLQPGGVDDWVSASLNRPLTTADRLWVDVGGRAELTMATTAMRLGSETSATIVNLDDQTAQIELDQGTLELSVRFLNPGDIVEVDTPNFAYTVERPGEYRFDVFTDQDKSVITVRRGDGEATGQGNAVRVSSGQQFQFSQGQSLSYQPAGAPPTDGFDDWCSVRERREVSSPSARYVAQGTIGYEDLDGNGHWDSSPMYGSIWFPNVHPGWAPYREGHWAWVEPWGWTWVDDASWGFAPFHYGRWVLAGDRWGWIPGPMGVRPVYAPAMVAWVGGPGFGVSMGIGGGVGWFPLGWHDPFIPSYYVSAGYARNVNISNSRVVNVTVINNYYTTTNINVRNTAINNIQYENVKVNGAVTGVSSANFASGKPIGKSFVVVPPSAVGHTSMMASAAVVPTKEAVLGGHAPVSVPQHLVAPRQVASRAAPPPRPVSFEQQRPLLEKSNGVPLTPAARATVRASNPPPIAHIGPVATPASGRPPAAVNQPPARNIPRPPTQTAPTQPTRNPPVEMQGKPPAVGEKTVPAAQPKATPPSAPRPAPEVHNAPPPPEQHAAPPPPPKKNPPPAKENKDKKDKDKDR